MLTKERFDAARHFLETRARPLERARFRHDFENATASSVVDELRRFQNADSGFGHGLEPDLTTPASSALCTSIAFQVLRTLPGGADEALVREAVGYLVATLDEPEVHWRIIPRAAEASPHAPWWSQEGGAERFDRFSLNPTAELLGCLYDHRALVPPETLALVSARVETALAEADDLEMHELLCCLRLARSPGLPPPLDRVLQTKLGEAVATAVVRERAGWDGYGLRPLQVAESPGSPFHAGLEAAVAENLDYEIVTQSADGSWSPNWTWGETYPEAWKVAHQAWSGVLTLEKLTVLRRFGRIEGLA